MEDDPGLEGKIGRLASGDEQSGEVLGEGVGGVEAEDQPCPVSLRWSKYLRATLSPGVEIVMPQANLGG